MTSGDRPRPVVPVVVDDEVAARLQALLRLDADAAEQVRDLTPARRRPRRQVGPSADYGAEGDPD